MTGKDHHETEDGPQAASKKQPPVAGTVAGRVAVPAVSTNDDPASPGADADRGQAEN